MRELGFMKEQHKFYIVITRKRRLMHTFNFSFYNIVEKKIKSRQIYSPHQNFWREGFTFQYTDW